MASRTSAIKAGPDPASDVLTSIVEGGRFTTRPMRENIHVTNISQSGGSGGLDVAITVIDSRTMAAVFGIARTIRHRSCSGTIPSSYSRLSIWDTWTPAKILIKSLP